MSSVKHGKQSVWVLGVALLVLALVAAGCGASGQAASSGSSGSTSSTGSTSSSSSGTGSTAATVLPAATNAAATGATEQPPAVATAATAATQAPAAGGSTSGAAAGTAPTGPAELMAGNDAKLGQFLVDAKGMTLYLYTKDTPNTSVCYDKCALAWPPLLTQGQAKAGTGLDAKLLGTTTRKDGTTQVTYGGWPLYYYQKDKAAGDVTGQDVGGVWYVVSPKGEKIQK